MGRWLWNRIVQWWWLDLPLSSSVVLLFALVTRPGTGADVLGQLGLADRRNVYTDMFQLAVIFAGVAGLTFTLYLTLNGEGVRKIKSMVGVPLLHVWLAALVTPWISALILVYAKVLDRGGVASENLARWAATGAMILVLMQLGRTLWIFYQLAVVDLLGHVPTRRTAPQPITVVRTRSGSE